MGCLGSITSLKRTLLPGQSCSQLSLGEQIYGVSVLDSFWVDVNSRPAGCFLGICRKRVRCTFTINVNVCKKCNEELCNGLHARTRIRRCWAEDKNYRNIFWWTVNKAWKSIAFKALFFNVITSPVLLSGFSPVFHKRVSTAMCETRKPQRKYFVWGGSEHVTWFVQ